MTRQEMIDALVLDWQRSIRQEGPYVIEELLLGGFRGYDNYSDAELKAEYEDAFDTLVSVGRNDEQA